MVYTLDPLFQWIWISPISRLFLWYKIYLWLPRILSAHRPLKLHACFHSCSYPAVPICRRVSSKMLSVPPELAWGQVHMQANSIIVEISPAKLLFCFFVGTRNTCFSLRWYIIIPTRPVVSLPNKSQTLISSSVAGIQPILHPVI